MRFYLIRVTSVLYYIIKVDPSNLGDGGADSFRKIRDERGLSAFQLVQEARRLPSDQRTATQSYIAQCSPVRP